ncbi:hypothetical protein C0993_002191 [Termitomyces sp. T159_Od127]|nr:hypothetical protein C0993_002191 [Termitomyces sp. T159_Od127]
MAKRKANLEDFVEENEANAHNSQKNKAFKAEYDSDYSVKKEADRTDESEQGEPVSKKLQSEKKAIEDNETTVKTTPEGDKYVGLGKKKRATVRSFKGTPLIDIREFYGNDGDEKPGKKGISLTLEQWETLKKSTEILDELLAGIKKK